MVAQWVQLGEEVLVATGRGAWLQPAHTTGPHFLAQMPPEHPGTVETTQHLVDGAIAAAERGAVPRPEPTMTETWWAWQLVGQWYSAHHSLALMPRAVERFQAESRAELVDFMERKLEEERGHDTLPLQDLRALGYDAEAAVGAVTPPSTIIAGLEYARGALDGPRPAEFLGYIYALERRIIRIPEQWFARLHRVLPDVDATGALRSHALSLDREHVAHAVALFATLPAGDRSAIAIGAHRTARIRCAETRYPSEQELAGWLSPYLGTSVPGNPTPPTSDGGGS